MGTGNMAVSSSQVMETTAREAMIWRCWGRNMIWGHEDERDNLKMRYVNAATFEGAVILALGLQKK